MAGALPKALKGLGHEVRLITPRYRTIRARHYGLRDVARLQSLAIDIGQSRQECSIKSGFVVGSKVQVYFLDNHILYDKPRPCLDRNEGSDNSECHLRIAFLDHAALQLTMHLRWFPDIIHCNGWQTALVPYLIRCNDRYRDILGSTRTLVHLHSFDNQGIFPFQMAAEIGFSRSELEPGQPLESNGQVSFLKAGVATADLLVTVSPTYAREILSDDEPDLPLSGLRGELSERGDELFGIPNGIDTEVWNPASDSSIPRKYHLDNFVEGKALGKGALQRSLDLPLKPEVPLVAVISDLTDNKGLDLLTESLKELLSLPVQLVFYGSGEPHYEETLRSQAEQHPDRIALRPGPDDRLHHLILAGADVHLSPSRCEPCGQNLMRSLSYGMVPVVRRTGRLADAVEEYSTAEKRGNGFTFTRYESSEMLKALRRALELYSDRTAWQELQRRGISSDFSWTQPAERLSELYQQALSRPPFYG